MASLENYERYKKISRNQSEKIVKLGLLFRDISEKENIQVSNEEIQQQLDILIAQAKQKSQGNEKLMPNIEDAKEEIENTLLRLKIFDFLAKTAKITYVDVKEELGEVSAISK